MMFLPSLNKIGIIFLNLLDPYSILSGNICLGNIGVDLLLIEADSSYSFSNRDLCCNRLFLLLLVIIFSKIFFLGFAILGSFDHFTIGESIIRSTGMVFFNLLGLSTVSVKKVSFCLLLGLDFSTY
jgi:hypothetical protein